MKKLICSILTVVMVLNLIPAIALAAESKTEDYVLLPASKRNTVTAMGLEVESKDLAEGMKFGAKMICADKKSISFTDVTDLTPYTELKFTAKANTDCQIYIALSSNNPETDGNDYYGTKIALKNEWREYSIPLSKFTASRTPLGMDKITSVSITTTGYSMTNDLSTLQIIWGDIILSVNSSLPSLQPTPTPTAEPVETASPVPEADINRLNDSVCLAINNPTAYAKGSLKQVDTKNSAVVPAIINSRTLVPVRFISESFDFDVAWDSEARKVSVKAGSNLVELTIGSDKMTVNGAEQTIDVPAAIINDRTMLPLRALSEALGKNVFWDERGLIIITEKDTVIDKDADFKTITAMLGYLKTKEFKTNYAAAPVFTKQIFNDAVSLTPNHDTKSANALYYMLLALRSDPTMISESGISVKDAALMQLRDFIKGGNEPSICSGPYWYHAIFASCLLLVKNTPAVFNELTSEEKDRCDLLMKALAITGNWSYNDENDYLTGTDLLGNFKKTWNPNYRNTYLSIVWTASLYFGAEELDEIFTSFDYDEYMAQFEKYGFTNVIAKWKPAGKELMENGGSCVLVGSQGASGQKPGDNGGSGKGVKLKFSYSKMNLKDPYDIFASLIKYTYGGKKVVSSMGVPSSNTYCYIISGKFSPYYGQDGMMYEFSITNGNEVNRSSASYCFDSFMIINTLYANYKLLFGWDSSSEKMKELDNLIYVGTQDLIFKLSNGYHGFSNGSGYDTYEHSLENQGYPMVKDMWRKFHCMESSDTTIVSREEALANDPNSVPFTDPMNGIDTPPESAVIPKGITGGKFDKDAFHNLGKAYSGDVTTEFDLVIAPDALYEKFDGVIMYDSSDASNLAYTSTNVLIQLKSGNISVMNGSSYQSTNIKFNANYRFHFKIKMNAQTKKYSVWITPTYPNAESEILVADNFSFRTSANSIDNIGQLITVSSAGGSYWIENHTVIEN